MKRVKRDPELKDTIVVIIIRHIFGNGIIQIILIRLTIGEIEKTAAAVLCQGNPLIMKGLRFTTITITWVDLSQQHHCHQNNLVIVIATMMTIQAGATQPGLLWDDAVQRGEAASH